MTASACIGARATLGVSSPWRRRGNTLQRHRMERHGLRSARKGLFASLFFFPQPRLAAAFSAARSSARPRRHCATKGHVRTAIFWERAPFQGALAAHQCANCPIRPRARSVRRGHACSGYNARILTACLLFVHSARRKLKRETPP